MLWLGYQIDTSVAFIIFAAVFLAILIIIITLLVRRLISAPSEFFKRRHVNQLKSGISELTYSIAALASSNVDDAEKHVNKVERLIGKTPLTLLLSAQIAKNRGEETKTQILLEQLLEHKETEYLAARSLSDNASRQDNLPKALQMAQKARSISPKDNASALAVISLQVRMRQWNEALANISNSNLPRRERKRIKALVQLTYGQLLLEENRDEEALSIAKSVIAVLPNFAPAVAFAAIAYSKNDLAGKAVRLVTAAFKKNPSALLEDTLRIISGAEPAERQAKLRAKLKGDINDGIWHCATCGHKQAIWKLHCDACSSFDRLEWK